MTVDEAIVVVRASALNAGVDAASYTDAEIKEAMRYTLDHFLRESFVTIKDASVDLTADVAEVDLTSLTDFRRERLVFAHATFKDRGTWADATAYVKNEFVKGDGTPDSKLYRCLQDHTSAAGTNDPGTTGGQTFWSAIAWKEGWLIDVTDWTDIARGLAVPDGNFNRGTFGHHHGSFGFHEEHHFLHPLTPGRPAIIAFENIQTAFVIPVPDTVYTIKLWYKQPLVDITAGATTINIADEYLQGALWWGVPAVLQHNEPESLFGNGSWQKYLQYVAEIRGMMGFSSRRTRPDPALFL